MLTCISYYFIGLFLHQLFCMVSSESNICIFCLVCKQMNCWSPVSWWRCRWVEEPPVSLCPTWPRTMRASTPCASLPRTALLSTAPTFLFQVHLSLRIIHNNTSFVLMIAAYVTLSCESCGSNKEVSILHLCHLSIYLLSSLPLPFFPHVRAPQMPPPLWPGPLAHH